MATEEDAELKELVIQTLENNGVLAQIRAKLRASVFLALEDANEDQVKKSFNNNEFREYLSTTTGKIVASLVYDFLRHFKLESTLSVYESESQFGNLYSNDDLKSLFPHLNVPSSKADNESLLNLLVIKCQELPSDTKKIDILPTEVPLKPMENSVTEIGLQAHVKEGGELFSYGLDCNQSSHVTLTNNKTLSDLKNESNADKNNSNMAQSSSKHLGLHAKESKVDGIKTSVSSLSSLNDFPPLPGLKGQLPQVNSGSPKPRANQVSKQSGEIDDYEDDFHSSASLNSAMKSDLNNSIEEEIEENISGNIDELLSYEGASDGECVTSDRTVSHISTTGIDYLESIG